MRVILSALAAQDLEDIGDFIAADNPGRAVSFVTELRQRCATLAEMPLAYPRREDFGKGVRLMVHRRYLVLYRVVRRQVRIERVLHGSRHVIALVQSSDDS